MMRKKLLLICFFILFISACQEIYSPDIDRTNNSIPVINANITNVKGQTKIQIVFPLSFNEKVYPNLTDAHINIFDQQGNVYPFEYTDDSFYYPKDLDFVGIPGTSYTLSVEIPDGETYQSDTIQMLFPVDEKKIYAQPDMKDVISKKPDGTLLVTNSKGLQVYADYTSDSSEKQYFRIETTIIEQHIILWFPAPLSPSIRLYYWKMENDNKLPNIVSTNTLNGKQKALKQSISFLRHYTPQEAYSDTTRPGWQAGWIAKIYTYKIHKDVYNYYQSVYDQLSADERIFDPIPSQINGNIYKADDRQKKAFGIFDVCPVDSVIYAFYWQPDMENYIYMQIPEYDCKTRLGFTISEPPPFWMTFSME